MKEIKTIGACGYGWTGSGAVLDLLKEYGENQVLDGLEFNITYLPDGLQDLRFHLTEDCSRFYGSDVALRRFRTLADRVERRGKRNSFFRATKGRFPAISRDYAREITELSWRGGWSIDLITESPWEYFWKHRVYERFFPKGSPGHARIERPMYYSVDPENFTQASRRYVHRLLEAAGCTFEQNIVLDQPFPANDPALSFDFFERPLAIVVDRDPRDLYILLKQGIHTTCIPTGTPEEFITYYRLAHKHPPQPRPDVLQLRFEDLVYRYEDTVKTIEAFCGLSDHRSPKTSFDPAVSIHNTQLFRKFPEYAEDARKIGEALPELVYPFPAAAPDSATTRIF